MSRRSLAVLGGSILFVAVLRALGPGLLVPIMPLIPLTAIGLMRYSEQRERNRRMRCPQCDLRLAYRRLGPSHGMLECPLLCGYRKLVGNPGAGR